MFRTGCCARYLHSSTHLVRGNTERVWVLTPQGPKHAQHFQTGWCAISITRVREIHGFIDRRLGEELVLRGDGGVLTPVLIRE